MFPWRKNRMHERLCLNKTRENPDYILIHVGTNDLLARRQPDIIVEDIIQLAMKLKTNSCDVSISNIVARNDHYMRKASAVNHKLKDLCK